MSHLPLQRLAYFRTDAVIHHVAPRSELSLSAFLNDRWRTPLAGALLLGATIIGLAWTRSIPVVVSGLAFPAGANGTAELMLLLPSPAHTLRPGQRVACEVDDAAPLTAVLTSIEQAAQPLHALARQYGFKTLTEFSSNQTFVRASARLDRAAPERLRRLAVVGGCRARVTVGAQPVVAVIPHLLRAN
jgi:hypothetical protein